MNVLVTGTPGCGKTTLCQMLKDLLEETFSLSVQHLNISDLVKQHNLHDGYDKRLDTFILDEDKLLDYMETVLEFKSSSRNSFINLIDYHCTEIFPESWIDLVVVLTTDNTTLYDRLTQRNYSQLKISENVECEIMQVVLTEARESYKEEIILVLDSTNKTALETNTEKVSQRIGKFLNRS